MAIKTVPAPPKPTPPNITIYDNGATYMICVDGLIAKSCGSLGDAWRHIQWMYEIATQGFTVGEKHTPVKDWLNYMVGQGYIDGKIYS